MSTRRRIGVSSATTEAARRQLMQPVTNWERVWVPQPGSQLKICKWQKTDKVQHFSDEEGEADEPLAPLPDELDIVEGDEEEEIAVTAPATAVPEESSANTPAGIADLTNTKPDSPQQPPQLELPELEPSSGLVLDQVHDGSLKMDEVGGMTIELDEQKLEEDGSLVGLDLSGLGGDGMMYEESHNLSQLDVDDTIMGGPMNLDQTLEDPFAA